MLRKGSLLVVGGSLFQLYYSATLQLGVHGEALASLVSEPDGNTESIPPSNQKPASLLLDLGNVSQVTAPSVSEVPARKGTVGVGEKAAAQAQEGIA